MKKIFCFVLAFILTFGAVIPANAANTEGGEGALHLKWPPENVTPDENVNLCWTAVDAAYSYWVCVRDTGTSEKVINEACYANCYTIPADALIEGHTYKIFVASHGVDGQVTGNGADWEICYISVEAPNDEPILCYATPNLTSPEVEGKYLSARGCYYGLYDGEIDPTEDFTIRWENVHSGKTSVSSVILAGEPDYGSTLEAKIHEIVIKKHQTSRKYTIDKEDLADYEGYYVKLVLQPIDDDDNYGLMGMYYFRIGSASQPAPEPTPDPEPNDTIFVSGVNTGYANGDYFSKNGEACTCHNKGICLEDESRCNCIRYIEYKGKTVDLLAVQCFGWSRYLQLLAFGEHDGDSDHFQKTYTNRTATASGLKDALLGCAPGTHIRTSSSKKGYAHSVSILSATSSGVTITDCNHTGRCQISARSYTYAEFAEFLNKYGGVDYISVYSKGSDEQPDDQPVYGGELDITLGVTTVSGRPGDILEIPLVINSPLAFLQVSFETNIPYCVEDANLMAYTEGNQSAIWYSATAKDVSGQIAIITLMIPEDAEPGQTYTFKVVPTSAYTASEKCLNTTAISAVITVAEPVIRGDVDGDGVAATPIDLMRLLKAMLGMSVEIEEAGADVDSDGWVASPIDLIQLLKMMLA